jgi:hypothetical protein
MHPNVIWTSTLDGKYVLTITRIDDYLGELTLSEGDLLLHREVVGLSYGARFGPDVADVLLGSGSPSRSWTRRSLSPICRYNDRIASVYLRTRIVNDFDSMPYG